MLAERDASRRFARLADELDSAGVDRQVVALSARAADDERRHALLCRELIVHYGGAEPNDIPAVQRQAAPSGLAPADALLYEVVALCCVTETLSTALLGAMVERAEDDVTRKAMRSILRDEVSHAQLGWACVAGQPRRAARVVSRGLPAMLSATVPQEMFSDAPEHDLSEQLSGMGALCRADRRAIFAETMGEVVFPGLERFGVDCRPGRRWLCHRHRDDGANDSYSAHSGTE